MSEQHSQQTSQPNTATEDEISLLDLAITLAKHKKLILGLPLVAVFISVIITFIIPSSYQATTKVMPVVGAASKEAIISVLQSQAMADSLINRLNLQQVYGVKSMGDARRKLAATAKIALDKDGTIDISVEDHDPRLAAKIANTYVEFFRPLLRHYGLTEASSRRLLLEKQLLDIQEDVKMAEQEVVQARQQLGNVNPEPQVKSLVLAARQLEAKIAMKEVELLVMGSDPAKNPNYFQSLKELSTLWGEFSTNDFDPAFNGRTSGKELEYLLKVGDVEYNKTRYDQLMMQVEKAKLDENRENPTIQVLDSADVPNSKTKPHRALIVVVSAFAAGFFAMLWAFVSEARQKVRQDPESREQLQLLQRYLKWN
jgi:uncharacterized protein involved in exopolysaccharide biosynthesis